MGLTMETADKLKHIKNELAEIRVLSSLQGKALTRAIKGLADIELKSLDAYSRYCAHNTLKDMVALMSEAS